MEDRMKHICGEDYAEDRPVNRDLIVRFAEKHQLAWRITNGVLMFMQWPMKGGPVSNNATRARSRSDQDRKRIRQDGRPNQRIAPAITSVGFNAIARGSSGIGSS
jgi:hypothetical protein